MCSIHEPPQALLDALVAESRLCLGDTLVGVYLHGSAAMGCYHPAHSDLDLLVVVHQNRLRPLNGSIWMKSSGCALPPRPRGLR